MKTQVNTPTSMKSTLFINAAAMFAAAFLLSTGFVQAQSRNVQPTLANPPVEKKAALPKEKAAATKRPAVVNAPSPDLVTAGTYPFTSSTAALEDMSTGTTTLVAAGSDDGSSIFPSNIGFDFWYDGVRFTQFAANANGYVRLGAAISAASPWVNGLASTTDAPKIMPYWDDVWVGTNGKVHFKTIGTAPTRKLIVEWQNITIPRAGAATTGAGTFQLWLSETSGVVEFVYGSGIILNTANGGYSVGLQSGGATNFASVTTTGPTVSYAAANDTQTNAITATTAYLFTPNIPADPTGLGFGPTTAISIQLNWTDVATNEFGYAIYRSLDGTNYTFAGQTAANAVSFNDTGLSPSTTYFYKVYAVTEGALSNALSGSSATAAPGNIMSNGTGGGLWNVPGTWAGGVVPGLADNVTIVAGDTVIINSSNALNLTVQSGGILEFETTATRTLTVGQSVTVDSGGTFRTGATGIIQHNLVVGTDLHNNGTLDFSTNADTAGANITFTGAANNAFDGSGATTDVRTITINKGTSSANILEMSPTNFTVRGVTTDTVVGGWLVLTNGTMKVSGTFAGTSRVFSTATYTIAATAGFWLNNPSYVVAAQAGNVATSGLLRVSAGTFNHGTLVTHSLRGNTGAVYTINGGTINCAGQFSPQSAVTYTQTGGTLNVGTVGNSQSNFGTFELFSGSSTFNMSGGAINIVQASTGATQIDYQNLAVSTITGGTLQVGTGATVTKFTFNVRGNMPAVVVDSTTNVKSASCTTVQCVIFGNLSVNTGSTYNVNNITTFLVGPTVTNNGLITSTGANARFDFANAAPMSYGGTGTFGTLATPFGGVGVSSNSLSLVTLNSPIVTTRVNLFQGGFVNSGQITLGNAGASTSVVQIGSAGLLTPGGSFDVSPVHNQGTGGEIIIYQQESVPRTTGVEVNPTRVLNTLSAVNTNGVTIAGGDITVNGAAVGALTMTNSPVSTGANTLYFNSAAGTVVRSGNGYVIGNFKKTFAAAATKSFEVGTANGFSPVSVNATAGTFPADFTVKAIQGLAPFAFNANSLARYWTLTGSGITANLTFTYLAGDVTGTVANYKFLKSSGGPVTVLNPTGTPTSTSAVINGVSSFSDWTLGEVSANADLSNLVLSAAPLNEPFAANTLSYTANVPFATTSTTVTPTTADATATVTVNGNPVTSGNPSGSIALAVGPNVITTVVTAQDTMTTKTYTVTVTRAAASSNADLSNLVLSDGTLTPAFTSGNTSYTASVPNATSSMTVTPTAADVTATIQVRVNGGSYVTVASGSPSGSLALNVGPNTIDVKVAAQDEPLINAPATIKTYTATVTRAAPSSNADLSDLVLSAGSPLVPPFASGTTSYTLNVPFSTASTTVTPTAADAGATITVNTVPVASGSPSGAIALAVGPNVITTVVTAQDTTTMKTYTVTVTRDAPTTVYVGEDSPTDFTITTDVAPPGLSSGDTVNWNPGGGQHPAGQVNGLIFGVDAFTSIDAATTAVSSGGTVNVEAGLYTGDVNVNKFVTFRGAQMGVDPNDGSWNDTRTVVANEATIHGAVNLSLQNVIVFDGFTLERTAGNEGHILIGSGNPTGVGATSSFNIRNNRFIGTRNTGTAWAGIHTNFLNDTAGTNPGNQFLAHQNRFEISGTGSGAGILVNANRPGSDNLGSTTITENYVANSPSNGLNVNRPGAFLTLTGNYLFTDDIFTFQIHTAVISNNTVVNSPQGSIQVVASSFEDSSDVTVSNNTVTNNVALLTNNFSQIDIRGPLTGTNFVTGNSVTLSGALPGGLAGIYGVRVRGTSATGVSNLTVNNNTLTGGSIGGAGNANFPPTSGVFVDTDLLTSGLDLHVVNNFVNGWTNAVSVYDTNGTGPGAFGNLPIGAIFQLFNNDLSGNSALVVQSGTGETVNASNNWWGTNVEASVNALTSGPVDFTPYLNVGTDTSGSVGFQGDFSTLHVTALGNQAGATGRVQEGIDSVDAGGTVKAHSGTYAGNVNATAKAVAISAGASPGQVTINGNVTLDNDDTVPIEINGTNAASDYDNFIVNGTVTLGGAALTLTGTHNPQTGDSFTIVSNDLSDAISGTFAGYAEGATIPNFLGSGANATITYAGGSNSNDLVITVLAPNVSVTVSPTAVAEDGATNLDYTFTRNGNTTGTLTVNFSVSGTADFGTDYTQSGAATFSATSGTVTFTANNATAIVTLNPTLDSTFENNETAVLTITPDVAYNPVAPTSASGTITNDDAQPTFTVSDVTLPEGNIGQTPFVFTVTKNGTSGQSSTVSYATVPGTATTADNDYVPTSGMLVFGPTDTSMQVTVFVNGDTTVEPDQTFSLVLNSVVNNDPQIVNGALPSGLGTIVNDDLAPPPIVYVDDNWVGTTPGTDPDAGAGPATNFGYDAFATIQDGVNGVANPGTVIVYAGTYPEAVTVNKSLTINGAKAGQNPNTRFAAFVSGPNGPKADPMVESILTAAATAPSSGANDTLHVMANNVTFNGFVVDGNNPALAQGGAIVIGGINTDSRRAIQTEDAAGTPFAVNNVTVSYNVIQNFSQRGVELINGTASNTAPATTGNLITQNLVRNFGLDGIVMAFNAYADVTFNTVVTNDYPTEAGIWVQDFLDTGTPHTMNITNNNVTVGQDNFGGIWVNLAYLAAVNINTNTVNAAAGVVSGSDFTYGIYVTSLRPGTTAILSGNIVGGSGGQFDRGIALWNVGTSPTTTTVKDGSVKSSVVGISLVDNDANFGSAGSSSAARVSGMTVSESEVGVVVDAAGSGASTVTMTVNNSTLSGNTAATGGGITSVGTGGTASTTVTNSTLSGNSPTGASILLTDASLTVGNSIFNRAAPGTTISALGTSLVTSAGYNLSRDGFGGFLTGTGDQINTNPMLGPLKNNGGPTFTHAPLINSPAIDQGKRDTVPALTTNFDQRGVTRPVNDTAVVNAAGGDGSDIGAVEIQFFVHPTNADSWKTHGAAGPFAIGLPFTGPVGIECRTGATSGVYQVIIDFANPVTYTSAAVSDGTGVVATNSGSGTNQITLNLTGVTNAQRITLALFDTTDTVTLNSADVGVRMGMLLGDVDSSANVNVTDVSTVRLEVGNPVGIGNFRTDVFANGAINSTDVSTTRLQSGTGLPVLP